MQPYRERVTWPAWVHLVMTAAVALCAYLGLRLIVRGDWLGWPSLVVALILSAVWYGMRFLAVEFGPEGAAFGFGRPRRRVARADIVSARAADYSAVRYMGWGYRLGWKPKERAYSLIGCPRGVELRFDGWTIFVACRDPERALEALGSTEA